MREKSLLFLLLLRCDLLHPASLLVHLEYLPVDLDAVLAEYPLDLPCNRLKIGGCEGENGRARSRKTDAEEARMGGVCQCGEDLGQAGNLLRVSDGIHRVRFQWCIYLRSQH
jgi:hypothetical protein